MTFSKKKHSTELLKIFFSLTLSTAFLQKASGPEKIIRLLQVMQLLGIIDIRRGARFEGKKLLHRKEEEKKERKTGMYLRKRQKSDGWFAVQTFACLVMRFPVQCLVQLKVIYII